MKRKILVLTVFALVLSSFSAVKGFSAGKVIDFHIAAGTGKGAWNMEATIVEAKVGDTVRLFNDDTIEHRLHTNGAPCEHGPAMAPGTYWDCSITDAYDPNKDGAVYDHDYGSNARFWIRATSSLSVSE